jgi:hypothetical protein
MKAEAVLWTARYTIAHETLLEGEGTVRALTPAGAVRRILASIEITLDEEGIVDGSVRELHISVHRDD